MADPEAVVAENLLPGQPASTRLNQVWMSDSTYLPLGVGAGVTWPPGAMPARGV